MAWKNEGQGTWRTLDGQWHIYPEFMGTTSPQGYRLEGPDHKSTHDRVRDAKRHMSRVCLVRAFPEIMR